MEDRSPHLPHLPFGALAFGAAAGLAVGLGRHQMRAAGDVVGLCAYSVAVSRSLPGKDAVLAAFRQAPPPEPKLSGHPWRISRPWVARLTESAAASEGASVTNAAAQGSL